MSSRHSAASEEGQGHPGAQPAEAPVGPAAPAHAAQQQPSRAQGAVEDAEKAESSMQEHAV